MRIVWEDNSDPTVPRLMEWHDSFDKQEVIQIIQGKSGNKVKKICPYVPTPQYLILFVTSLSTFDGMHEYLVLRISPNRTIRSENPISELRCFGKFWEAESIYDYIRYTQHDVVREVKNELFFEELEIDSRGELFSVVKGIMGIFQAVTACISDKTLLHYQMNQLMEVWEN